MLVWRIAQRDDALDRSGARAAQEGGRWNRKGEPAIYAASTVDLAQRESEAKSEDRVLLRITLPNDDALLHRRWPDELPTGWDAQPISAIAREYGSKLLNAGDALALMLPSASLPQSFCVVINPKHPQFADVKFEIENETAPAQAEPVDPRHPHEREIDRAVEMTFPASDPIAPPKSE